MARSTTLRCVAVVTGAYGVALVRWPERVLGGRGGALRWAARVLGARYALQAGALLAVPVRAAGPARTLDVVHAASMLPLLGTRRWRRPALVSAAGGAVLAAGVTRAARAAPRS